jgi:hypothetical protein
MKITRRQLRQVIKETLLLESQRNPSWNLFEYTRDVFANLKTTVPDTGGERSELAVSIRDIYTSISSAVMAFAVAYDDNVVNTTTVNRNIDRAISELEKIRSVAAGKPEEIALFTGDSSYDISKMPDFPSAIAGIEVRPRGVQAASLHKEDD